MKSVTKNCLILLCILFTVSCSKSNDDDGPSCETNETTKVTFNNTGSTALRVELASQFNAQFEPVNPVFVIDLAPGTSSVKEFRYGRYFIQWRANCASTCTQQTFYAKTFDVCQEYQETQ